MKITDSNDTMIPIDIVKVINEIARNQLTVYKDTIHVTKAQVYSETIHATVLTVHAHNVAFSLR